MMEKCIDISRHQTAFDAAKCKNAGITTVMCRLAYGKSKDVKADIYMKAVKSAGLKLGGYGFGTWHYKSVCNSNLDTAVSVMKEQLNAWISIAKEQGCNSWVGIDQELESKQTMGLSIGDNTTLLIEAAKMIESAGLHACLYASASWIMANVNLSRFTYPLWVAYYKWYGTKKDFDGTESFPTTGTYGKWMTEHKNQICMWQFTSEGYASKYGATHGSDGLDKNWLYYQPNANVVTPTSPAANQEPFDEYCLFPMSALRVTQGLGFTVDGVKASAYSHLYHTAYEFAGKDTGKSPVYAPFSCEVMRIYNGSSAGSKCNFTWFANTKRVKCMNGKVYKPGMLFVMMAHCDTSFMQAHGIRLGAKFSQGEVCYSEGNAGGVGSHCHMTFGEGPWDGKGWHEISNRRGSFEINNPLPLHKICWMRLECKVLDTGGYTWVRISKTIKLPNSEGGNSNNNAGSTNNSNSTAYFPAYTGTSNSIITALNAIGVNSSYSYREKIAQANGITGYRGTAQQNLNMVALLKKGLLVKPGSAVYFPAYTGNSGSIAAALNSLGIDSSYSYREKIAAKNGITGYKGTPAQNTRMLNLLKQGKLLKP